MARKSLIAIGLGVLAFPAMTVLFGYSGGITVALYQLALDLGLAPHAKLIVRGANAAVWTVIIGALLGLPLGFFVHPCVLRFWLVFSASALMLQTALASWSPFGIGLVALEWAMPEQWLYFLGVLLFAYVGSWLCERRGSGEVVAP